jgi:hypothetical protein
MADDRVALLSAERLRELLDYDCETGVFTRRTRGPGLRRAKAGTHKNSARNHYVVIGVDGRYYRAHNLAWLWMTGEWPSSLVDHADLDGCNNCWSNLRAASRSQNMSNRRSRRASGIMKGVGKSGSAKTWKSSIKVDGESIYLGSFNCPAAAHFAYVVAADKLHGEFARFE